MHLIHTPSTHPALVLVSTVVSWSGEETYPQTGVWFTVCSTMYSGVVCATNGSYGVCSRVVWEDVGGV